MIHLDMTWAPGRAPAVTLLDLPDPLVLVSDREGFKGHRAYETLDRHRLMGNQRLETAKAPSHWQAANNSRVCEGVSLITFGDLLDLGFLVATRDRIMPFAFLSHGGFDATIAALRNLVPAFEAIAQVPWFLADSKPSHHQWTDHAIAPPWLKVHQQCDEAEQKIHLVLAGLAITQGLTNGRVYLMGGRFDAQGRFVPPSFGHWPHVGHATIVLPKFDSSSLWPGPFPFLRQDAFDSEVVDVFDVEHLKNLSAHERLACVQAFQDVSNPHVPNKVA